MSFSKGFAFCGAMTSYACSIFRIKPARNVEDLRREPSILISALTKSSAGMDMSGCLPDDLKATVKQAGGGQGEGRKGAGHGEAEGGLCVLR